VRASDIVFVSSRTGTRPWLATWTNAESGTGIAVAGFPEPGIVFNLIAIQVDLLRDIGRGGSPKSRQIENYEAALHRRNSNALLSKVQ
jgi:hypothetical protein